MHTIGLAIPNLLMREQAQGLNKLTVVAHPLKGRARGHLAEDGEGCWERALMVRGWASLEPPTALSSGPQKVPVLLLGRASVCALPSVGPEVRDFRRPARSCRAAAPTTKESLRSEGSGRQLEEVRPVPS